MNSKKKYRPSLVKSSAENAGSVSRHSRNDEEFLPDYLTLKLYYVIRSKNLIQAYFHHGICLSYTWIMRFYDELSASVESLYRLSGRRVLPSILRIGVFTVVIDDNLDANGSSLTGTSHFHGSSVSILQFPTTDKPGIVRVRPSFSDLSAEDQVLDLTTLDSYTKVPESKLSIKNAPYPEEKTEIPQKLYDDLEDCLSKGTKEELK